MKPYDANKMMEQLKKVYVERVVRNGFEDGYLYTDELLKLGEVAVKDFKELKGTDMDKCGISIIAGMGPFREGMNNPIARFNARANASYILRMRAPTSGFDVLEYYDANQASVACAMTLT